MAHQLAGAGARLVRFGDVADVYIINSCTVTHIGDRKSRQLIRQAARANPDAFIAVAGCYAETDRDAVLSIPGVSAAIGNSGKDRLVELLEEYGLRIEGGSTEMSAVEPGHIRESSVENGGSSGPVPARTRAFVKIQDGCDNRCSYCIVPTARGHRRSRPASEVISEIGRLVEEGFQEVVLTGVNITSYGRDYGAPADLEIAGGRGLYRLLERILAETAIRRVRLSSLQPEEWDSSFYDLWESGRICRHLHLSLQSGSPSVLARMRRRYSAERYARLAEEAREALPGVALTTDVIVGFPGETEKEYQETEEFVRSIGFAGLHVFKYSPRAGTDAAVMPGQVDPRVKQDRSNRLSIVSERLGREFHSRFLGSVMEVLWEQPVAETETDGAEPGAAGPSQRRWSGLSDNYLRVYASDARDLAGTICGARVIGLSDDGVTADLVR